MNTALKSLQPEDVAAAVLFVASLPPRAHVPELYIKPRPTLFIDAKAAPFGQR